MAEGTNGRDNNPYGYTMWMAGGGVKGGLTYGRTDEFDFHAVESWPAPTGYDGGVPDMKKTVSIPALVVLAIQMAPLRANEAAQWMNLFDGQTLDGWVQKNGTATYEVRDGTIVGTTAEGSWNSFLCTEKEYGDFELEFEVRLHDKLNSGVQIRSKTREKTIGNGPNLAAGRVIGPQVEIEASRSGGAESGYIYAEATGLGWLTPKDRLKPHKHLKDGQWNHYRIVAKGPRIQTWINGVAIEDLTHKDAYAEYPRGFIGLQVHRIKPGAGPYDVVWRNIRIKEFASAVDAPIALHPDNPHYFTWKSRPTILLTSGEHYGALLNLDFDFERYFDELHAHGLNHTRTFSGTYREIPSSFRITDNPLAPKPNRYIAPWVRSGEPGYYDGGNKFDLTEWDDGYFKRLRDFMRAAQKRGVVVELTLFCPMYKDELWKACPMNAANNINGIGDCPRTEALTLKHQSLVDIQVAVTRKIVQELRDFDNLYYEVCNEPYFGGVTMDWQHKIVDAIVETEKDFPAKHLISMNIANGRQKIVDPHPAVSIFNFHYCVPPDTVAMNFGLNKIIGENETGFRGHADVLYRTEGWDFLIAGGALYNNLDYSFTPQHPDGSFTDYSSPGGGSRALRRQLHVLKQFLDGFDFIRMTPDNSVIRRVVPDLKASALVDRGKAYAVYVHVPLPKKPKELNKHLRKHIQARITLDLPAGRYTSKWVDTESGDVTGTESFQHGGGDLELVTPRFDNDVALRVIRTE